MKKLSVSLFALPILALGLSSLLAGCGGGSSGSPGPTSEISGNYAGSYDLSGSGDSEVGNIAASISSNNNLTFTIASPSFPRLVSVSGPISDSGLFDFRRTVNVDGQSITLDFEGEIDDELPGAFAAKAAKIKAARAKNGLKTSANRLKIANHVGLYLFGDLTISGGGESGSGSFVLEGLPSSNVTVGSYTGSFRGDQNGTLSLQVDRAGFASATLVTGGRSYTGRAVLDPVEGTITILFELDSNDLSVVFQGEFIDANPIRIEGEFEDSQGRDGTFTISKR